MSSRGAGRRRVAAARQPTGSDPTAATRIGSPGDIVGSVPYLTGFVPTESLVAMVLLGQRRRVGVTSRADLAAERLQDEQVRATVRTMVGGGANACVLVTYTDEPDDPELPRAGLVAELVESLQREGVEVHEALLARGGRWWSYLCDKPCCPREGTPCKSDSSALTRIAAHTAFEGRAVLRNRAELVASLGPALPLGPAAAHQQQTLAAMSLPAGLTVDGAAVVAAELDHWRAQLDAWHARPRPPSPPTVARLVMALHLIAVRDHVIGWAVDRPAALHGLLLELCRSSVGPDDAPVCAALATVAYAGGNGALAVVAAERALATDPDYALARLLLESIDGMLPPRSVRDAFRLRRR